MKLVVKYNISDGCTYSCDIVQPMEFESPEALLLEFDKQILEKLNSYPKEFRIAGIEFSADDFRIRNYSDDSPRRRGPRPKVSKEPEYFLPDIYSLDDWFNTFSKE